VRDLLAIPYGDAEAQRAIDLTVTAWNLPALDWVPGMAGDTLRRDTREAAAKALSLPPDWKDAFLAMMEARATRFSYDRRLMVTAKAEVQGANIYVRAAALRSETEA
jgi:hypothetical protein